MRCFSCRSFLEMSAINLRCGGKEKRLAMTIAQQMSIYSSRKLLRKWANRNASSSSCLPNHHPVKVSRSWQVPPERNSGLMNQITWINSHSLGETTLKRPMRVYLTSWRDLIKWTRHGMVITRCLREQEPHQRIRRLLRTCRRKCIRWLSIGLCSTTPRRWLMPTISRLWMSTCRRESQYLRTTSTVMRAFSGKRSKRRSFGRYRTMNNHKDPTWIK